MFLVIFQPEWSKFHFEKDSGSWEHPLSNDTLASTPFDFIREFTVCKGKKRERHQIVLQYLCKQ